MILLKNLNRIESALAGERIVSEQVFCPCRPCPQPVPGPMSDAALVPTLHVSDPTCEPSPAPTLCLTPHLIPTLLHSVPDSAPTLPQPFPFPIYQCLSHPYSSPRAAPSLPIPPSSLSPAIAPPPFTTPDLI